MNLLALKFGIKRVDDRGHITTVRLKTCCFERQLSSERNTRTIESGLRLWLWANSRSERQVFYFLTVDFDPYQLFVTDVLRRSLCKILMLLSFSLPC